jgi:hypothetical protein
LPSLCDRSCHIQGATTLGLYTEASAELLIGRKFMKNVEPEYSLPCVLVVGRIQGQPIIYPVYNRQEKERLKQTRIQI